MSRLFFNSAHQILLPIYKDRLNRSQLSKVIYKASCWDCNDFYIGKTKRRLHDRKTEHFKALLKNDHSSAIADHVKNTGHNIKWHLARLTSIVRLKRPYLFESYNQH